MHHYDTVSEAINDLVKRGYKIDLNISEDGSGFTHDGSTSILLPAEFNVDEVYRFEGTTDPGDEMIVFALSSPIHSIKGVWANAFGIYADEKASEMILKLNA